jgi:hypothetical protein
VRAREGARAERESEGSTREREVASERGPGGGKRGRLGFLAEWRAAAARREKQWRQRESGWVKAPTEMQAGGGKNAGLREDAPARYRRRSGGAAQWSTPGR